MGAHGSARAVAFLGSNFVWAHAGDEIRRIAKTSFFIGLSRKMYAIQQAANIGPPPAQHSTLQANYFIAS